MNKKISLTVNNTAHTLSIESGEKLSTILRQRLGLTGTKIGCGEGRCGTCTVLIDGQPKRSCLFPAERADGKAVLTIEGLAEVIQEKLQLHPLQEAFLAYGTVQCGFCIPGQIMAAYALLQEDTDPSPATVRRTLKRNLCRCGSYPAIEQAVLAAAKTLRTGEPLVLPELPISKHQKTVIGRRHLRPDAIEKVTGEAIFTDDIQLEGMLYAKVRRAGVPHAILTKLDASEAEALPGVAAVLTADDIPGVHNHGVVIQDWPVLVNVGEQIRYVGDAIAIVAAETEAIAVQAVELIQMEFTPLPVISGPVQSKGEGQPQIHENGNMLKHIKVRKGDVCAGFEAADVVLEHTFHTQTTDHMFMEPECSIAEPTPDGRLNVYVGSQIPYEDRSQVAEVLGWDKDRVRIVGQHMGGGFGGKEDIAGQIHAALAAWITQRPVKLLYDRRESMLAHPKRHATQIQVKIGAQKDGKILAVETELYGDTGAYASLGEIVMARATTHSAGPYEVSNVKADCYAMYTNNPPAGAFRGFGVTQSMFAIESMIDLLSEALEMDPVILRKMNALRPGSMTNTGQVLDDSVGLLECLEKLESELLIIDPEPFSPKPDPEQPHIIRSWGLAAAYKNTGLGDGTPDISHAELELFENGRFEVRSSAAEMGQGLVAVMQMVVSEELSTPSEDIDVLVMDTDLTPDGGPTTASRQTYVTGNAARHAAIALREGITAFLAEKNNLPPSTIYFKDGRVHLGDKSLAFDDIAKYMIAAGHPPKTLYRYEAPETQPLGTGGDMHFAYSYAAQAAQVEVNTETGEVKVLQVIAATDVGSVINPLGLKGQIEGGVIMGVGHCLTEEFIVEEGRIVTDRIAKYKVPGIMMTPEIKSIIVEQPTVDGPYGAKGVGEISSIPTTPAITNAIYNAVGVRIDRTPVDPNKLVLKEK